MLVIRRDCVLAAGLLDLWPEGVFLPLVAGVPGAGLPGPGLLDRVPEGVLDPEWVGVVVLADEAAVLRAYEPGVAGGRLLFRGVPEGWELRELVLPRREEPLFRFVIDPVKKKE